MTSVSVQVNQYSGADRGFRQSEDVQVFVRTADAHRGHHAHGHHCHGHHHGHFPDFPQWRHHGCHHGPYPHHPSPHGSDSSDVHTTVHGKIEGDPHFTGAMGQKYDVQGKAGHMYNLLRDDGINVNAKFQQYGDGNATTVGEMGITLGNDYVNVKPGGKLEINGEQINEDGVYCGGKVIKEGNKITVLSDNYKLDITDGGGYLNTDITATDAGRAGGLWGQSMNGTAIDTKAEDFEVGSLYDGGGCCEPNWPGGSHEPWPQMPWPGHPMPMPYSPGGSDGHGPYMPEGPGSYGPHGPDYLHDSGGGVRDGSITGDPHFDGAEGQKYDVMGKADHIYNLLTDGGIEVNGKFQKWGDDGATTVGELGINVDGHQVDIKPSSQGGILGGGTPGKLIIDGQEITQDGTYCGGRVVKEGNKITVANDNYKLDIEDKGGYLDTHITSIDAGKADGLWGQSMNGTAIDTNAEDFERTSLFRIGSDYGPYPMHPHYYDY